MALLRGDAWKCGSFEQVCCAPVQFAGLRDLLSRALVSQLLVTLILVTAFGGRCKREATR